MAVKSGYKQTEVGVIPEEWAVLPLAANVQKHNSGIYKNSAQYGKGCNIVGVSDIYDIDCVDGQQFADVPLTEKERAKYSLKDNDLLYGESSLVREGIARTVHVTGRGAGTAFAWHTRRYSVKQDALSSAYLYYYLQSRIARMHMMSQCIQTALTGINTVAYFACPILVPPLPEQRAIAAALSDVDALLGGLERLIAKKRDLKQAAMQQLLTGQTRLPGFSGEWEVKRLGEVAGFYKGKGLPKSAISSFGAEPCIHYGELFTRYPETISEIISRTDTSGGTFRSVTNDVLMPTSDVTPRGLAKASCVRADGVILGGDILVIRSDTKLIFGSFLSYLIRYEEEQVLQLVTGSTVFHLYGSDMKKFTFSMPSLPEQAAIAAILSDMDAELSALVTRRDKTRDLKQTMMQELLTGRTRLV